MHGDEFAEQTDTGTATISERYGYDTVGAGAGGGGCRLRGVARGGFGRAVSGVDGAWRATRAAADATVRRAKRFFFRDEG